MGRKKSALSLLDARDGNGGGGSNPTESCLPLYQPITHPITPKQVIILVLWLLGRYLKALLFYCN